MEKKIKKQPSPGAPEAAEGAPIPTQADGGADTIPWPWGPRGASVLPGGARSAGAAIVRRGFGILCFLKLHFGEQ